MSYKHAFFFLAAFVLVFISTKYIRQSAQVQKWFTKQTYIEFNQRSLDFGNIPPKKAANAYFVFTNTGSRDLKIESIDARCGCTITDWPKNAIKPSEKDSIFVQYDAAQEGFFLKEIYVFSNAETSPDLLSIKGTVNPVLRSQQNNGQ